MLEDMKLAAALLLALPSVAFGDGLTARFGMTFSPFADEAVPDQVHEVGPLVAIGDRVGPFVGEVEWAYLSLFDPQSSPGGVHRFGVTLRADVWRNVHELQCVTGNCRNGNALYVEGGAGERFGQWITRPTEMVPLTSPQPEIHIGAGFEMDNELRPHRNGWQLGLRFSMARGDQAETVACRTTGGTCVQTSSGTERALFVEWMFLLGN
jgi:hypothetical protein